MAKQASIITLKGRVGRLSFYKTKDGYLAREKGGVEKSRIMNDPRFARTRENMQEFTDNANSSKLVKDALRPVISKVSDPRLGLRLNQQMMKVLKSDALSVRGERKVKNGNWDLLGGMELNIRASLSRTLLFDIRALDSPASWEVQIPTLLPSDEIAYPTGAEGFRIIATGVGLDFDAGTRSTVTVTTPILPVSAPAEAAVLSIDKSQLSGTHFLFVLSVEFYLTVNSTDYHMNNGDHNAGKIMTVSQA
ncbi:hypothetical protein [Algoriphagus vanfongensis]|uniref:hypothetical protein n=1 Tax=Algoriphagus vanfongensis TaxID=426371 RepID=UPI00041179EF|nr:hypothetical protein [Algoriphagus vanfongensis]